MNGIVEKRKFYINKLLNKAEKFKKEADKIKGKADAALENVQLDFCAAESKLTADFREKNLKEKASLYDLFSRKSKEESKKLEKSSTNTLLTISQDMDELIDLALQATVKRKTS
jgi:F0F1-type ATP synthase membrane subunit b/b'